MYAYLFLVIVGSNIDQGYRLVSVFAQAKYGVLNMRKRENNIPSATQVHGGSGHVQVASLALRTV